MNITMQACKKALWLLTFLFLCNIIFQLISHYPHPSVHQQAPSPFYQYISPDKVI